MQLEDLKRLVDKEVKTLKREQHAIEVKACILKEIMPALANNRIFNKEKELLKEYFNLEITNKDYNTSLAFLKEETKNMQNQFEILHKKIYAGIYFLNCYHYKQHINALTINYLKDFLTEKGYSDIEIIKIAEKIKIYNSVIEKNQGTKVTSQDLYLITNMLNQGYEKITIKDNPNYAKLDEEVNKLIILIANNDLDVVEKSLNLTSYYSYEDLEYIYKSLLKYYQDKIYELIEVLKIKEFYFDTKMLYDIKVDYKDLYQKYIFVRQLLDSLVKPLEKKEELELVEEPDKNKLYYASNNLEDASKSYIMSDLMSIREESLNKILTLLKGFKKDDALVKARLKYLTDSRGFMEIKDGQIRIVLKPMYDNNYCVMGAFIKKADNDPDTYRHMFIRPINLDDAYASLVDKSLEDYCLTN